MRSSVVRMRMALMEKRVRLGEGIVRAEAWEMETREYRA